MTILETLRATLAALTAERAAAVAALETLNTAVVARQAAEPDGSEARSTMLDTESATLDATMAQVRSVDEKLGPLQARITELEDLAARQDNANRRAPAIPGMGGKPEDVDVMSRHTSPAEIRARARSFVEQSHSYISDSHKEAVTKLIDTRSRFSDEESETVGTWVARMAVVLGSPVYARAWFKLMNGNTFLEPDEQIAAREAQRLQRAMNVGTTTAGGFGVPTPLDPTLILTGSGSTNPFRQISRVIPLTTGNTWKGLSFGEVSISYDTEASAVSDDSPTAAQPSIAVVNQRGFVPASYEAFEDIENLAADVVELLMDAKDQIETTKFTNGSGTNEPMGIYTAVAAVTASRVSAGTGGAFSVGDPYLLDTALPPRHRREGVPVSWITNAKHINSMRQFATANNYHAYLTDAVGPQPRQLLGWALRESSAVTTTVTTGNDILLLGRFDRFAIVEKLGTVTEFVPNLFDTTTGRPTGQRGWFMHSRNSSGCLDTGAFRILRL